MDSKFDQNTITELIDESFELVKSLDCIYRNDDWENYDGLTYAFLKGHESGCNGDLLDSYLEMISKYRDLTRKVEMQLSSMAMGET